MTNEEHIDIRITRKGKRNTDNILDKILGIRENRSFPSREDHDCMYEDDLERAFQYSLKRNPILERLEPKEAQNEAPEQLEQPAHLQTLKPMLRDAAGALEQSGQISSDAADEVVWVQIDRQRARSLERILSDFAASLRRAFNTE